jgi:hypothetical protein
VIDLFPYLTARANPSGVFFLPFLGIESRFSVLCAHFRRARNSTSPWRIVSSAVPFRYTAIPLFRFPCSARGVGGLPLRCPPSTCGQFALASVTLSIVPNGIRLYPPCRPARSVSMRVYSLRDVCSLPADSICLPIASMHRAFMRDFSSRPVLSFGCLHRFSMCCFYFVYYWGCYPHRFVYYPGIICRLSLRSFFPALYAAFVHLCLSSIVPPERRSFPLTSVLCAHFRSARFFFVLCTGHQTRGYLSSVLRE